MKPQHQDEVAEWLRRWTANPMCSARVGSNPIGVVLFFLEKDASMQEFDIAKVRVLTVVHENWSFASKFQLIDTIRVTSNLFQV